jgi:hypothetical protein
MARLAVGGVVPANLPDYLPQVRTGGIVVHTPPIDYDKLAAAVAGPTIDYEALGDVLATKLGPVFVAGAKALPAPETNLTELRQHLTNLDKRDAQTNI